MFCTRGKTKDEKQDKRKEGGTESVPTCAFMRGTTYVYWRDQSHTSPDYGRGGGPTGRNAAWENSERAPRDEETDDALL